MHIFIFEGIDGAGKTSVIKKIIEKLEESNTKHIYLRVPSNAGTGKKVYELLNNNGSNIDIAEALVDDFNNINTYLTALKEEESDEETIVIIDRYVLSFLAYQSQMLGKKTAKKLFKEIRNVHDIIKAFILDIDPVISIKRLESSRGRLDAIESKGIKFLSGVRENYLEISSNYNSIIIDATDSVESMAKICMEEINVMHTNQINVE
ncbi:MAG: dTMP kinase [Chlamydiia bacterium]|nr:dTMP kinase [Chlamydiia bacterium]